MKLLYVWIEEFRNIKNLGFNLSGEYKVAYANETNSVTINKQIEFIPNFFSKNISDIAAIVGKNGTGKSNILDFICTVLVKGNRNAITKQYFLLFEKEGEISFFGKTNGDNLDKSELLNSDNKKIKKERYPENFWNCLFFSNVADNRTLIFENNETINLSYKKNQKNQANKIKYLDYVYKKLNGVTEDYITPLEKLIDFNKLTFNITAVSPNLYSDEAKEDKFSILIKRYETAYTGEGTARRLRYFFTASLLYFLNSKKSDFELEFNDLLDKVEKIEHDSTLLENKIARVSDLVSKFFLELPFEITDSLIENSSFSDFVKLIDELSDKENDISKDDMEFKINWFKIKFSRKLLELLMKYSIVFNAKEIITHDWDRLSSGFKAYLNLFANIYSSVESIQKQNVLICIDEGDLYFHPEMQRNFLRDIIEFFKSIIKQKNIQIIFTSHSPFLAADLPKDNLILLKNMDENDLEEEGKAGITKISHNIGDLIVKESNKHTFASNVYQLYNNQFFLDNGSMGEFAKSKIQDVIQKINEAKEINLKDLLPVINKIGDEAIQKRLLELLHEKQSKLNRESKDLLINWYHEQIKNLK